MSWIMSWITLWNEGVRRDTRGSEVRLIRARRQTAWRWPAVVNFTLGGMAAGFYVLSSLVAVLQDVGMHAESQPMWFRLLAPVLTGLAFLSLTIEAGQPLRGRYLLCHLRRSWMSRETLAGAVFILAAALDWLFPYPALRILAVAAAIGLMISHGFIVYRSRGMTAWNVPIVPLLFVTSAFAMGSGLLLLLGRGWLAQGYGSLIVGLICVVLDLGVWLLYLRWSGDAAFREATKPLRHPISQIVVVGIGHLLPILLLLAALGYSARTRLGYIVAAVAGLAMVVGGMGQRAGMVLRAGYLREIVQGQPKGNAREAYPASSSPVVAIHGN